MPQKTELFIISWLNLPIPNLCDNWCHDRFRWTRGQEVHLWGLQVL